MPNNNQQRKVIFQPITRKTRDMIREEVKQIQEKLTKTNSKTK
jgi:hypothetical protein